MVEIISAYNKKLGCIPSLDSIITTNLNKKVNNRWAREGQLNLIPIKHSNKNDVPFNKN